MRGMTTAQPALYAVERHRGPTMPASQAVIATPSASKYLQQLCKHWSHKFAVEFSPEHGTIPFDETRRCTLDASPERLALRIDAADDTTLERMQGVVIEHLKRFSPARRQALPAPRARRRLRQAPQVRSRPECACSCRSLRLG